MTTRCSVVILNFNGRKFLQACLDSVLAQDEPGFEVILVDNGSTDGSAEYVEREYGLVRVVRAGVNLGFAEGNNLGVREARGELIVLLNNDTIVAQQWLRTLLQAVDPPDVALASSFVRTEGIPERYYERNGSVNFAGHNIMRKFPKPEDLFYATGASLVFKRSRFGEPFDGDYFAYSEDLYLGLRARFMGYRVVHVPASRVHHFGGGTTKSVSSPRMTMLQERNRLLTMFLFFSPATILRIMPLIAVSALGKLCAGVARRRYSLPGLLAAYGWLLAHPARIRRKRALLRPEKRVPERTVIAAMTSDLTNGESALGRFTNHLAAIYCRAVGLRTIETSAGRLP